MRRAPPASPAAVNPDAEMIAKVHAFIAFHHAKEEALRPLLAKPPSEWTAEDHALDDAANAENTGYDEDMAIIAGWEPATPGGLGPEPKVLAATRCDLIHHRS